MPDPTRRRTVRPIRPVVPGRLVDVPFGGRVPDIEYLYEMLEELEASAAQIGEVDLPAGGFSENDVLLYVGGTWTGVSKTALLALGDLSDVVIASPSNRQVLLYESGDWVNDLLDLHDLSDVTIGTPATGETLRYNGTAWVDAALALDDLSDVQVAGPLAGVTLRYNGTLFVNARLEISDLSDVETLAPTDKQVITYDDDILLWRNLDLDISWLTDFNVTAPADGDVLTHDGAEWLNRDWVEGPFGIGQTPTAWLHLKAGTATAGQAPLKLTAGTNLTAPEAGTLEFDGTDFFATPAATRMKVPLAPVTPAAYTPTNVSTDRSYDANVTTLDEIADVLGSLIADLQAAKVIG